MGRNAPPVGTREPSETPHAIREIAAPGFAIEVEACTKDQPDTKGDGNRRDKAVAGLKYPGQRGKCDRDSDHPPERCEDAAKLGSFPGQDGADGKQNGEKEPL